MNFTLGGLGAKASDLNKLLAPQPDCEPSWCKQRSNTPLTLAEHSGRSKNTPAARPTIWLMRIKVDIGPVVTIAGYNRNNYNHRSSMACLPNRIILLTY